ncbi:MULTISPECIES: PQQ-binding-like beta-propeller repeat protein [unclassified Massilia]|uniref:outer membrane protein assembly factor BamB family protein n=1 Tax=unclassified Massilia TaxID=2609279 RepID=UPI0017862F41|nr:MULTISPECIES: PQQ-binding-like beta-propeller repeat protein [unclassified Massilia]MBD8529986.1 PQQ-binding-like beta-propeller repeat protein [Massilia sp. CFBP 13647]MBD8673904.1 PQQ-binding-like beta-propeller repeat protein [Massilia sp. CFBP 13721]
MSRLASMSRSAPRSRAARRGRAALPVLCAIVFWCLGEAYAATTSANTSATAAAPARNAADKLFTQHCAACHSGFLGSRAPSKQVLATFPPSTIVHALTVGVMRAQGYPLSGSERRLIAEYVTGKKLAASAAPGRGRCDANPPMGDPDAAPRWNGWGNGADNASFQSAASAGVDPDNVKRLKLRWAFGFPDSFSAWSQPVFAADRLFVGSQGGMMYSLSAQSGCTYWQFAAEAGVRGAASVVTFDAAASKRHRTRYGVLFGDMAGNAYALDANSGRLLWKTKVDAQPKARITGSPVLAGGRYLVPMSSWSTVAAPGENCCTFRGSLSALDVASGKLLWQSHTIAEKARLLESVTEEGRPIWGPSGAAIWAPPLVDERRRLVYVGTGNSYTGEAIHSDSVLAFDLDSGALRWAVQLTPDDVWVPGCAQAERAACQFQSGPNLDIASPPMMVRAGGRELIVVGQKSGVAYALDPEREGALVWQYRAGSGGAAGGIVWGSAALGETVFFPLSDIASTAPGGLHAVDAASGRRLWTTAPGAPLCGSVRYGCNGAQPVGISVVPGLVFAGSVDGGFRAHASGDGRLLWEFDTNRDFETVNGVAAAGGSLIGSGPTVGAGMVFVNSGYGTNGGRAGNVLLAFSIE